VTDPAVTDPAAVDPSVTRPGAAQSPSGEQAVAEPDAAESDAAGASVSGPATGPTGHPVVDAAVAGLAEQAELPPAEQVGGYEAAHRALSQTLASIDQG
jgi:hypothetical protein